MTRIRDKMSLGKKLRKYRETIGLPLVAVTGFLKDDYKIECSITNLAKIERGEFNCKANLIAALALIYEVDLNDTMYIWYINNTL